MNWSACATIWSSTRISQCRFDPYGHWIDTSMPACLGSVSTVLTSNVRAGQHRRLFAVDVRVVDLVRDHRSAGCAVRAGPVDDVVQHLVAGAAAVRTSGLAGAGSGSAERGRAESTVNPPATTATAAMAGHPRLVELMRPTLQPVAGGNSSHIGGTDLQFLPSQDHRRDAVNCYRAASFGLAPRAPQRSPAADAAATQAGCRTVGRSGPGRRAHRSATAATPAPARGVPQCATPAFIVVCSSSDLALIQAARPAGDGCEPGPPADLVGQQVAEPRDHGLIHQRGLQRDRGGRAAFARMTADRGPRASGPCSPITPATVVVVAGQPHTAQLAQVGVAQLTAVQSDHQPLVACSGSSSSA